LIGDEVVVDASVAAAWCIPDEASHHADEILVRLETAIALVPAIWSFEVVNVVLMAERCKRITPADAEAFFAMQRKLVIHTDSLTMEEYFARVLPLARGSGLSAYDAAYLELALRAKAPLATFDRALARAATERGVRVL
jgi:predicted nucleic acid-binding protein